MIAKFVIVLALAVAANAGAIPLAAPAALVAPAPAAYVAPYASSYSAHAVNHAVATPVVAAAPYVAAPAAAPYIAAPAAAPYVAAPAAAVAAPAPYFPAARYVASPYYF
ncbi:hypothetical protein ABMA28_004635 [Loxostege sticticalis]|uniref:Uncharacterized protein n=1 Tax=Loxostege sticticalis TaxID=481309 RepID=A0ABD0SRX0_LOXSC